jgi:hypothetical protein
VSPVLCPEQVSAVGEAAREPLSLHAALSTPTNTIAPCTVRQIGHNYRGPG